LTVRGNFWWLHCLCVLAGSPRAAKIKNQRFLKSCIPMSHDNSRTWPAYVVSMFSPEKGRSLLSLTSRVEGPPGERMCWSCRTPPLAKLSGFDQRVHKDVGCSEKKILFQCWFQFDSLPNQCDPSLWLPCLDFFSFRHFKFQKIIWAYVVSHGKKSPIFKKNRPLSHFPRAQYLVTWLPRA
jgi:hypothetical protein